MTDAVGAAGVRTGAGVDSSMSVHTGSTTAGGGAELIAVARREREIAKHGELEYIEGRDKECSAARRKQKQCSISSCSKKSRWECKVCGAALCHWGDCVLRHQSTVRENMKEIEHSEGWV